MTFGHGSRPMAEESHDEGQDVGKESRNRGRRYTSSDGKDTFPDVGGFCQGPEGGNFFDSLVQ
jgi:hypothetical protein